MPRESGHKRATRRVPAELNALLRTRLIACSSQAKRRSSASTPGNRVSGQQDRRDPQHARSDHGSGVAAAPPGNRGAPSGATPPAAGTLAAGPAGHDHAPALATEPRGDQPRRLHCLAELAQGPNTRRAALGHRQGPSTARKRLSRSRAPGSSSRTLRNCWRRPASTASWPAYRRAGAVRLPGPVSRWSCLPVQAQKGSTQSLVLP